MKLDERFMTILTALLVLVGVGAMLNRGEDGESIFSSGGNYKAKPDSFTLRAGRVQSLDVLLNDSNADRVDAGLLQIVAPPHCGVAEAVAGAIQYSDSLNCEGAVALTYCVPDGDACTETTVALNILKPETGTGVVRAGSDGSPAIVDVIQQGNAPQEAPQLAMRQPKRLSLPTESEVITPAQAAEDVRALGRDAGQTVAADAASDSNVVVSNTSARSGRIETAGVTLQAPDPEQESVDIALAQPSAPASPSRPAAPGGLVVTSVESPRFDSAPSINLSIPAAPASDTPVETEVAIAPPVEAEAVPVPAQPEPQEAQPEAAPAVEPEPVETQIASADPAPEAQSDEPSTLTRRAFDAPDTSGVFASLARGSSVFGAGFSAAKALFAPAEVRNAAVVAPAGYAAPRPQDFEIVTELSLSAAVLDTETGQVPNIGDRPIASRSTAEIRLASLTADPAFVPRTSPAPLPPEVPALATDEPVQEQAADVAALTTGDTSAGDLLSILPAPRPTVECDVDMVLKVRVGAEMQATLSSPCRPDTPFTVEHAGISFTGITDLDGVSDFIVPAMSSNATVSVSFDDGAFTVAQAEVENMSRLTRVAIVWDGDMEFSLNAYEFGAEAESVGHIRPSYPRDYRNARRAGGGYLMQLGQNSGPGAHAQVYTIFESSRTEEGLIDLDVAFVGSGDACAGEPNLRVIRTDGSQVTTTLDLGVRSLCGAAEQVVVDDLAGNIDMAQR